MFRIKEQNRREMRDTNRKRRDLAGKGLGGEAGMVRLGESLLRHGTRMMSEEIRGEKGKCKKRGP